MKKLVLSFAVGFHIIALSCSHSVSPQPGRDVSFRPSNNIAPGYFVVAIAFDSKGTAWLGTLRQGLLKYDGSLTLYDSRNSPLPDSVGIGDIAVDGSDNVWIASTRGLIRYSNGSFTIYDTSNTPMVRNFVNSVAVDDQNTVWFASWVIGEGGLIRYDGNEWTLFTPENSSLPNNIVQDIQVDDNGDKWIAVNGGIDGCSLVEISGDSWTLYDEKDIGFKPYYWGNLASGPNMIYASIDYSISSSLDTTRPNIVSFNGIDWTIRKPVNSSAGFLGYVWRIAVDRRGFLWGSMMLSSGLAVFDGQRWIPAPAGFLNNSSIFTIAVDKDNTVWLGCGNGVYLLRQG